MNCSYMQFTKSGLLSFFISKCFQKLFECRLLQKNDGLFVLFSEEKLTFCFLFKTSKFDEEIKLTYLFLFKALFGMNLILSDIIALFQHEKSVHLQQT